MIHAIVSFRDLVRNIHCEEIERDGKMKLFRYLCTEDVNSFSSIADKMLGSGTNGFQPLAVAVIVVKFRLCLYTYHHTLQNLADKVEI